MKLLLDFLPIILFFVSFNVAEKNADQAAHLATDWFGAMVSGGVVGPKEAPVLLATVVVIVATLAQVLYLKLRGQKVDTMLWVSLVLVTVLGGATIWFHSEAFIKWKPTVLYWVMGAAFLLGPIVAGKNILKALLGAQMVLPEPVWQRLNWAWAGFFAMMGVLNLYVAFNFETSTWVNFKLFGGMGLMLVFTIAQGLYLGKYLQPVDDGESPETQAAVGKADTP
ncbi:MAG: septation protein A [Burkholderiales bacterium]|nr:septation protein A [Burkholderiales bacterium]